MHDNPLVALKAESSASPTEQSSRESSVASISGARRRRWLILAVIFGAIVLNYIDRQILSILKPTLKAEFGFDDRGYGFLVNVFTVGYAAMYPVLGWLVDRFGVRLVMLAGIFTWSTACIGAGM